MKGEIKVQKITTTVFKTIDGSNAIMRNWECKDTLLNFNEIDESKTIDKIQENFVEKLW